MPTLKQQIQEDVKDGAAWWNEDEFADWHDVNGKRIMCVFIGDSRMKEAGARKMEERPEGLHVNRGVLFLRAADAVGVPRRGQKIRVDGRLYAVDEARLIGGSVMRIGLEANEP